MNIIEQVVEQLQKMSPHQQQQVLAYVQNLSQPSILPPGESGSNFVQDIGYFDAEFIASVQEALKDSRKIDWDGWE